jgi:DNA-binding MarR family transcriptional regulator
MSYTRIPNDFIDNLKLNPYQFQILSIIVRKTDGWCKVEDGISLSQFEKLVTFKKPKIIQTLKELEDMDLISKQKQVLDNNANGFNMYRISKRVVTENNKGSNQGLQGVVTEDYTQKKTNTKETKQNLYDSFIDELKSKAPIKSKVTSTTKGRKLFKTIEDKEQLIIDYIDYQKSKKEYAIRITDFMEDYNTVYKNSNINYDDYLTLWNEFASKNNLRTHPILTSVNKNNIKARLEDYKNFFEIFKYSLVKAKESSFLMNGDYFDFEWLIANDDNIIKVYKGKYDDKKGVEVTI